MPERSRPAIAALLAIAITNMLFGCSADRPLNPSFPLRIDDARTAWRAMVDDPRPVERPVIVLGGVHDPGLQAGALARKLRRVLEPANHVLSVTFFTAGDFETCRRRVLDAVEARWPGGTEEATIEVDVIGISMGGLVARLAARPGDDGRRLAIRRLFTIASPHRGAVLAGLPTFDRRILDMRAGSDFLAALDAPEPEIDPELIPYTRLDDAIVGEARTAPPWREPWWVANIPLSFSHMGASRDPRIVADIARRLRGEGPFTTDPAAPLP